MTTSESDLLERLDTAKMTRTHWRWCGLAAVADYFDGAAIAGGAVSLTLWANTYGLTDTGIGVLAALSANGLSAGIGGLVGGWLADRYGRARIFTLDLILFMVGAATIALATGPEMIIVGYVLTGFAIGVDVPISWSLLAEFTPSHSRGKVFGLTLVSWLLGPVVVSLAAAVLAPLGDWVPRLIFGHLVVLALVVWWFRREIPESPRWAALHGRHDKVVEAARMLGIEAKETDVRSEPSQVERPSMRAVLVNRKSLGVLAFVLATDVVWGIPNGTYGFFLPYLLQHSGGNTASTANLLNALSYLLGIVAAFVFMAIADRVDRRLLWTVGCSACALAFLGFLIVPVTTWWMAVANVVVVALMSNLTASPILQVWSAELFPTAVRGTLQGISFSVMRLSLGAWSLVVAGIANGMGFAVLSMVLGGMWLLLLVIGLVFGPDTARKSMAELDAI